MTDERTPEESTDISPGLEPIPQPKFVESQEEPPVVQEEQFDGENRQAREVAEEVRASQVITGLRIEATADENEEWHWMLFSSNGRPLATNVEPYKNKYEIRKIVKRLKDSIREAQLFIRKDDQ